MIKINENVLSDDLSPYLKQHKDNPVNWQTWSKDCLEFAKKNIHYNNSTLFKRFEWIKRNRNNENLNSFNINLKSYNPILASLTNKH